MDRFLLLLVLAIISCGSSLAFAHHPTSVVGPVTTEKDSRCWPPFKKGAGTGVPDIVVNTGDAFNYNLIDYYAAGDVNVTNSAICTSIAPTFTAGGTITPGGVLTQSDKNNATYGGTASGSTANNTYTIKVTNSSDATGFTDSIDWHVTGAGVSGTVIPEGGVNYFVCPTGGNDAAAGNTHTTPWATVTKVNGAFSSVTTSHAKVWFCAGSTFTDGALNVDWPGTSIDQVVIGTYYISGGVAYQLLPDNPTADVRDFTWSNGARAIIRGTYRSTCRLQASGGGRCAYTGTGNGSTPGFQIPAGGWYTGIVRNEGYPYVTVQSLEMRDSAANGLQVDPFVRFGSSVYRCTTNPNCQMYGILQYNKSSHSASGGIYVQDAQYMIVRGNEVEFTDMGDADNQPATVFGGNYFGHCDPCNIVVENNFVHDEGSEGPDCLDGSFILFRGNKMSNSGRVNLYHDGCADLVNELNVIAGGQYTREVTNTPFINMYGPAFYQMAIIKEPECSPSPTNCQVHQGGVAANASQRNFYRNNIAVNMQSCLVADLKAGQIAGASGGFIGNTCIGAAGKTGVNYNVIESLITSDQVVNKNNLFVTQSGAPACSQVNSTTNLPFDHNAWTGTPTANCRAPGTGDVYTTFAGVALPAYAHFGDADKSNFPAVTDVTPTAASTAVMALSTETSTYLDITKWQWVYDNMSYVPSCAAGKETSTEWVKKRSKDFCGATPNTAGAR